MRGKLLPQCTKTHNLQITDEQINKCESLTNNGGLFKS